MRAGSGYLHIGRATGQGYDTACFRSIRSSRTKVWLGAAAETEWRVRVGNRCPDCTTLRRRGWATIKRITGW